MKGIKHYFLQHKIILAVDVILLVIYAIVTFTAHNMTASLYSQQQAMRWENDEVTNIAKKEKDKKGEKKTSKLKSLVGEKKMPYAQVSAFISPGRAMQSDDIVGIRSSVAETLKKDSYSESLTDGRVWIDAYSCESDISLRKDNNTLSVKAVGVGGEFFQFHPMKLLSGSYISESDLNHDRIVVDENFAWAMFGSNDIVGMQLWLGDNIYFIAGVVEVPKEDISLMAYGNTNRVYMDYNELKKAAGDQPITCYEAVLPNPISNYAYYTVRSAFGLSDESDEQLDSKKENPLSFDDVEILENTKRYNTMELLSKLKNWRLRTMRTSSVGYPYWENVARVQDDTQMVMLLLRYVLLVCPIISAIWLLYGLWKRKTWTLKGIILGKIESTIEERKAEKYYAKEKAKESGEDDDIADEQSISGDDEDDFHEDIGD